MGGLCTGSTNKKIKTDKKENLQDRQSRQTVHVEEEKKENNLPINSKRRISNPRNPPISSNRNNNNNKFIVNEMNNDIIVNNINNHFTDLNANINNIPQQVSSNRIFDSQSLRNKNVNNDIQINNQNIPSITERTNNINFNNLDRNSNNMINISINDELSSRRNYVDLNAGLMRVSEGGLEINNRGGNNSNSISLSNRRINCQTCHVSFANEREFDLHLLSCRDFRNNRMMHNINEILQLVQSLNRHLQSEGRFNSLSIFGLDEPEDVFDFIDWKYNNELNLWKNEGKINITTEELMKISQTEISLVKNLEFWQKRLWFLNYINKNVYDKSSDNTTLVVSRNNILEESFNQFMTTHDLDLKKSMQIFFVDEVAIDIGGVYREWYSSLFESIFSEKNGFFFQIMESDKGKQTYFIPIENVKDDKINKHEVLLYYEFIGKIMGKAMFDKITIKGNFNLILIKFIMDQKIVLEDLAFFDISFYRSLKGILENKITDDDLNFTWNVKINGQLEIIELIENGAEIFIDETNKYHFVEKVVEYLTYTSIKSKIDSLKKGFNSIIPKDIINTFHFYELDFLLSGQGDIDIKDWKANTIYKGKYHENHPVISNFWEILTELKKEDLLAFYKFCTGCTRVPIDGFGSLQGTRNKFQKFCIESPYSVICSDPNNRLIEANTCFNRIYLPQYETKVIMRNIIFKILENDTNYFGKK